MQFPSYTMVVTVPIGSSLNLAAKQLPWAAVQESLPIGIGLVAYSSDVLLRDILQGSRCEEHQDARAGGSLGRLYHRYQGCRNQPSGARDQRRFGGKCCALGAICFEIAGSLCA